MGLLVSMMLVVPAQAKIVMLAWDASPTPTVTGYKLHISEDIPLPAEATWVVDVGNYLSYIITGLYEDRDYYFACVAYDVNGNESARSNTVTAWRTIMPPERLMLTITYFDTVIIR